MCVQGSGRLPCAAGHHMALGNHSSHLATGCLGFPTNELLACEHGKYLKYMQGRDLNTHDGHVFKI